MQSDPVNPVPGGRSRRRLIALSLGALLVTGAVAAAVVLVERPPWLHDVKTALQQVPVIGQQPGIVAAPSGLPTLPPVTLGSTPPPVTPGATPNPSFAGSADTIPLENRPEFAYDGMQPWQIQGRSEPGQLIEGYASAPSYFPRDVLKLAVSTTAPSYVATIWRVSGSAPADGPFVRVATIESTPGRQQAAPVVDATTKMVRAPWDWTITFPIPPDWPSGVYLVRLDSTQGAQS